MFYRRKILLALIEAFGGHLNRTDCEHLLLLFCMRRGKNFYDFFPHKHGSFSIILAQDRQRLAELGYISSQNDFHLQKKQVYIQEIQKRDQGFLQSFAQEFYTIRGKELIHQAYLEAPHYACRSQITQKMLNPTEYQHIRSTWNTANTLCLFTLGYEGLSIDAYLDILVTNNVTTLVDVRKNPLSMKYGFSKTKLATYTQSAGMSYIHLPNLGIPSQLRRDLKTAQDYQELFQLYATDILPQQETALSQLKELVFDRKRVAITCFEADHIFCHRHKVTEYLEQDPNFKTDIIHLRNTHSCANSKENIKLPNGLYSKNTLYSSI